MRAPSRLRRLYSQFSRFGFGLFLFGAVSQGRALDRPVMIDGSTVTASELEQSLRSLGVTGRVLHLAAHPDDENTRLLTWLANEVGVETAYLSLTRGDGGQNLIGPELREKLGLIRTQELLAARRIDGARQFFSRAVDFGYSKTKAETLRIWDHEAVLADVVWVIRSFQPDVIITRFEPRGDYTHGHHTASAYLAVEGFEAAADPTRFPEQLSMVDPWQAKRVVWNTFQWFYERQGREFDPAGKGSADLGVYLPLRGESTGEIAARGRSMHKSQGFGAGGTRGSAVEYFELLAGEPMDASLFDGVTLDWSRVAGREGLGQSVAELVDAFDPTAPQKSVPALLAFRKQLATLPMGPLRRDKEDEVNRLIAACLGLYGEFLLPTADLVPGQTYEATLNLIQRLPGSEVEWEKVGESIGGMIEVVSETLPINETVSRKLPVSVPSDAFYDHPYWLRSPGTEGLFTVEVQRLIGTPENRPSVTALLELTIAGEPLKLELVGQYRRVDPVAGEVRTAGRIVPAVYANFANGVELFPGVAAREVTVKIGSNQELPLEGFVRLEAPAGWSVSPASQPFNWSPGGNGVTVSFSVAAGGSVEVGELRAIVEVGGARYDHGFELVDYAHIPPQVLTSPSMVKAVHLDVQHGDERIGYLPGAGDAVAECLRTVGLEVVELDPTTFSADALMGLDAVVVGIRALNTIDTIDSIMPVLFAFVEQGGTVVVQYNTSRGLKTERLAPFPLTLSRDRVTDEHAAVTLLAPEHPVLNSPNRLTSADFDGWVQERGLYFPSEWDAAFTPIISCHDEGEAPLSGGLLIADYGEGRFVYTGISFFRQLPAGVPGAYRLFLNLLSHD